MSRDAFLKRLRKGYDLQLDVGRRFLSEAFIVNCHPYSETKSDDYDLLVKPTEGAHWREVEVKGNGKYFTSIDDFPYQGVFVETVKRWEKRESPPVYYVIVSYKTGEALCINSRTHEHWTSIRTKDTQKNFYDDFLVCPKEHCETWDQMINRLGSIIR